MKIIFSLQIEKVMRGKRLKRKVTIFAAYWELIAKISPSPIDDHCNEPQKSAVLVRSRRRELMGLFSRVVTHNTPGTFSFLVIERLVQVQNAQMTCLKSSTVSPSLQHTCPPKCRQRLNLINTILSPTRIRFCSHTQQLMLIYSNIFKFIHSYLTCWTHIFVWFPLCHISVL